MSWISNVRARILMQFETTFKVSPTGTGIAAITLPVNTCTLRINQDPQPTNLLSAGRHASQPFYGDKVINGDLTGPLDLLAIGHILKAIFGVPTTTGSASPYTHTFKIGNTTPSFLIEKGWRDENKYYLYNGCKATGFTLNIAKGQPQYTLPIIGAVETYSASSYQDSPTTDLSKPAVIFDIQDISAVTEGGGAITTLEEFSINFVNNPQLGYGLGLGGVATVVSEGVPAITGRIKGLFDGDTLPAKGRNKTESALTVVFTSGSYSLAFYIDELKYGQQSPVVDGPAGAMIDLPFLGYYQDAAAASEFRAVLINSQASYA